MTREEAIKIIEDECEHIKSHLKCKGKAEEYYKELGDMCIAFYMAINALEQEPCEDAISRQAVLDVVEREQFKGDAISEIEKLSPVKQEPKTGHWIEKDGFDGDTYYDCSECGESFCLIDGTPTDNLYNYCPNCGARMRGENDAE